MHELKQYFYIWVLRWLRLQCLQIF